MKTFAFRIIALIFVCNAAYISYAQQTPPAPLPLPQPTATTQEEQESIKVYTQEVRLPIVAYNGYEQFYPILVSDDILLLEDNIPQQITSVRREAANVLLVLDLSGQVMGSHNSNAAREAATKLVNSLGVDDKVAIIQNSNRVDLLQDWTSDVVKATRVIKTKFFSSNRSRLSECLMMAASKLKEQPIGNTHVIVFSDGLEIQTRKEISSTPIQKDVLQKLAATQASVHIFGFASITEQFVKYRNSPISFGGNGTTAKIVIDTDFEMRRWFRKYAQAIKQRDEQLANLAEETGGRIFIPTSTEEILTQADKISRDIRAQYVITYAPKRAFANEGGRERRSIEVFARRAGLEVFSLRNRVIIPLP